jgi:hypothetical protein
MSDDRERWLKGRVTAYVWYCGDETCDCTQPVVERITPNLEAGFPWIRRERLWTGTFRSGADPEESAAQRAELAEAAAKFGVAPEAP